MRVLQPTVQRHAGRCQVEAAIAALHDDAASAGETAWPRILAWYDDLVALTEDPVHELDGDLPAAATARPPADPRAPIKRFGRS